MRLVCPNCAAQYEVDASLFPDEGREVQCSSCEEVWTQYPVADEAPIRLDTPAAPAPRPSDRLGADERAELARAVDTELAAHRRAEPEDEEEDIVAALRQQIAAEGSGFEKADSKGPARTGKRDIRKAAENIGISVEEAEEEPRRWNLDTDREPPAARGGLAAALRSYEEEAKTARRHRRKGGMKAGVYTGLLLVILASGAYVFRAELAEAYPPAGPYLDTFAERVATARLQVETIYAQYGADLVDQAMVMVGDLTGGETPAE